MLNTKDLQALRDRLSQAKAATPEEATKLIDQALSLLDLGSREFKKVDTSAMGLGSLPLIVQFKTYPYEDSYLEEGMYGVITRIDWNPHHQAYKVTVDSSEFLNDTIAKLPRICYPTHKTRQAVASGELQDRPMYSAFETGEFNINDPVEEFELEPAVTGVRDDAAFFKELMNLCTVVEPI